MMLVEPLEIWDVLLFRRDRIKDARGHFTEVYNRKAFEAFGAGQEFVQDNETLSVYTGTLRGLHFQTPPDSQAKLVRVVCGATFDVAVDLREASPSYGRWCGTTLRSAEANVLFIPAGFAHGYVTLEPNTIVAYKVDRYYNKHTEAGIYWDDPDIGIAWPIDKSKIKISDKDRKLPRLREAETPFEF